MPEPQFSLPSAYLGDFRGYIDKIQEELEAHYGEDANQVGSAKRRAKSEAPYIAARNWLIERWGEDYPCPVCQNIEWAVSGIRPALNPAGFLTFSATCSYCANTMQVVPDYAERQSPWIPDEHPHIPASEK